MITSLNQNILRLLTYTFLFFYRNKPNSFFFCFLPETMIMSFSDSGSEKDDDSDSDSEFEKDEETMNVMNEISDLKSQLVEYPKLKQLKSNLKEISQLNPRDTPLIKKKQEIQLNIFKIMHIQQKITMCKLQLVIKFIPITIWKQYYDNTTKKISKHIENFEKLPPHSQKKLKQFASRDSLPTSLQNPPWYHDTYRKLLIEMRK